MDQKELEQLEAKLSAGQWLGGAKPSELDRAAYDSLKNSPALNSFPRVNAWLKLVSKFSKEFRASWGVPDAPVSAQSNSNTPCRQRTFIMIKPDAIQRGLMHKVIIKLETRGF